MAQATNPSLHLATNINVCHGNSRDVFRATSTVSGRLRVSTTLLTSLSLSLCACVCLCLCLCLFLSVFVSCLCLLPRVVGLSLGWSGCFIWAKPRLVGCILSYMRHDHEAWLYDMALALLELARFISPTYDGGGLFAQFVAAMTTTATPPAWCQVSCVGYHMSGISIISALRMFSLHGSNLDRSLFSAAVHTLTSSTSRGTIIYYGAMMSIPLYRYALSCI